MSFEVTPGRRISKELHRLARKGLRRAIEGIDRKRVGDAAVHEARKNVKKVRAILKLLQRPLGRRYAGDNNRLRTAARQLSNLRDADAMLQTFEALCASYGATLTPRSSPRSGGACGVGGARSGGGPGSSCTGRFGTCAAPSAACPNASRPAGGHRRRAAGFVRSYRRARAAMEDITMASDAAEFHRWRRRVKDHWYQVRLFAPRHRTLSGRVRSLRRLETDLGDDHDLAVLRDILLGEPEKFGRARTTAIVLGCIEKRQHTLRRLAVRRGRRLFAASPRRFRASVVRHIQ